MKALWPIFALLTVSISAGTYFMMHEQKDAALGLAHPVTIALGQSVSDFLRVNDIVVGAGKRPGALSLSSVPASQFVLEDWIELTFQDGAQGFELPPGRTLHVGHSQGVIGDFALNLFAEPRSLDEVTRYLRTLITELERKNWIAEAPARILGSAEHVDRHQARYIVAQFDDVHRNSLEITMIDYGLAPKMESFILRREPTGRSNAASNTYIVQVQVMKAVGVPRP